jgi:general secretion pathway protein A
MARPRRMQSQADTAPQSTPFPYKDYVLARTEMRKALAGPSFYALLTGASGMGKTSLLRELTAEVDRHSYQVLYVSSSNASMLSIVRFVAQKLRVVPRRSYLETVDLIVGAIQALNSHLLLWVDEADLVAPATLQEVRILTEATPNVTQLFSIVLSGLPPLTSMLEDPALFPLKRRIGLRCALSGLRRNELETFLVHRFGAREAKRVPEQVLDDLFERTQATPALIDKVVRNVLNNAKDPIDPEECRAALDAQGL